MTALDTIVAGNSARLVEHERRITEAETGLKAVQNEVVAIRISLARVAGAAAAGGLGGGGLFVAISKILGA